MGEGAPKHYIVQKNMFELFALTGSRDTKTLSASVCALV